MDLQTVRTLVVEDSEEARRWLIMALGESKSVRYLITTVRSLAEAGASLAEASFDLILLDLGLPGSDGLRTLHRIQAVSRDIPIVIVTGADDETMALQAIQAGALEYVVKGQIAHEALLRTLRQAIVRSMLLISARKAREAVEDVTSIAETIEAIAKNQNGPDYLKKAP